MTLLTQKEINRLYSKSDNKVKNKEFLTERLRTKSLIETHIRELEDLLHKDKKSGPK